MIYVLIQFISFAVLIFNLDFNNILYTSLIMIIFGLIIGFMAIIDMRPKNLNVFPELKENHILITKGIYTYIRHPMYLSIFITFFGIALTNINYITISVYLVLIIDLYLKSKKEEMYLSQRFKDYKIYQNNTGRFLPKITL